MKIKNFTKVFLFVAVAALFSCGSSDDNGGNAGPVGPVSISVAASSQFADFGDSVTFTVSTNDGVDVTSEATIVVNDANISGNSYSAPETGEYTVKATYAGLTSAPITVNFLPVIVSIEIQTAQTTYNLGDRIEYVVMAIDNDGNGIDVTSGSTVYVDGNESFSGNVVIPGEIGTIDAYGTFNEFTSDMITVTVEDNATTPGTFARKALIEDYTGTWCGWCPRVSYGIELCNDQSDNVVAVAVHNNDPMANGFGVQMENAFNVTGFPTAYVNRAAEWAYPEPSNVNQVTNQATGTMPQGVAVNSAIKGNNLSFMVSAGFGQNVSNGKLVIFLLENGLIYNQTNYTTYYGGTGGNETINGFVHDHVLRHSFTNVLGDAIPASEMSSGNTYRMKFDYEIPAGLVSNAAKVEIVAMLLDANGEVINVNVAKAGEFADFN